MAQMATTGPLEALEDRSEIPACVHAAKGRSTWAPRCLKGGFRVRGEGGVRERGGTNDRAARRTERRVVALWINAVLLVAKLIGALFVGGGVRLRGLGVRRLRARHD